MENITFENKLDNLISTLSVNDNCEEMLPKEDNIACQKINNVLLAPKNASYSKLVSQGIQMDRLIKKLTTDLKNLSGHLKIYGKGKIDKYNKDNFDSVKSIKIPATDDSTCLVSVKSVTKLDKESILKCKAHIDKTTFDSIFEEKHTYTLKEEFADKIITLLKKVLGGDFLENSFTKSSTLSLKNKEALSKFLNDESIDEKLREKIEDSIKLTEMSITY
jgi:hypothetical protein